MSRSGEAVKKEKNKGGWRGEEVIFCLQVKRMFRLLKVSLSSSLRGQILRSLHVWLHLRLSEGSRRLRTSVNVQIVPQSARQRTAKKNQTAGISLAQGGVSSEGGGVASGITRSNPEMLG